MRRKDDSSLSAESGKARPNGYHYGLLAALPLVFGIFIGREL